MGDVAEFFEYWRTRIEKDLSPFADPGTQLEISGDKRLLTANWTARGRAFEAGFALSLEGGVQVTFRGQSLTYKSFLASPEMADLLGLAKMILQAQPRGLFVATKAVVVDASEATPRPALEVLQALLSAEPSDVTRIVMVTGEAGSGKTRVLQELVKEQAQQYQRGRTDCLYLYINAQGRALARFNEALATELQDLRAAVTYHAVSALVRLGILVPVIDGFDELLGVGGYDDAFSSLTGFIEELDGQGQIVASARSTYYEQEFVARASSVSSLGAQAWTQIPVEVHSWGEVEFGEYVRQFVESEHLPAGEGEALRQRLEAVFSGRNAQFRQKPLFVARTVDILKKEPSFQGGDDLLKELVAAYLERERREKLLDRHAGTLLTTDQMRLLFCTLAEEMWNQETRELDRRSVREVAEFVLVTEGVSEGAQRVVIERMPQLAFFSRGERSGGVSFEHEMFFSYFLAQVFEEKLLKNASATRVLLSRSVLPYEVAATAVDGINHATPLGEVANAQLLLDRLGEAAAADNPRASQIRENAGLIATAVLKAGAVPAALRGVRIARLVFPGGDLKDVKLEEATFDRVEMRRVDLTRTRLVRCIAEGILLSEVVVDPASTRLELAGLDPASQLVGLRTREHGLAKGVYDPAELQKILAACGAIPPITAEKPDTVRRVAPRHVDLLERLARAYRRTNPVCTADDNMKNLFGDSEWPRVEHALIRAGVVTRESRQTGGRPKTFLRRQFLPEQIMAGADRAAAVPSPIRALWDELEGIAKAH